MKVISYAIFILLLISFNNLSAKEPIIDHLEPSCWWKDMGYDTLQLLVHGKNIENCDVAIEEQGITILNIQKVTNPNYLFLSIKIESNARSGIYPISFKFPKGKKTVIKFELKERIISRIQHQGFSSEDAIYLLMPDRFANGDIANDNIPGMLETVNRESVSGRHGGDIKGIINHLDYITNIGFTSLWINPLLENNMKEYSYHGYSITDFYKIDPRFGRNIDYVNLVDSAHLKGLKIIADLVLNHCGTNHWFVNDPPDSTWFNNWDSLTYSNFRGEVMIDPYSAGSDKTLMEKGWFAPTLADFNLSHPLLLKYMIQNTLWWIEYAGFSI